MFANMLTSAPDHGKYVLDVLALQMDSLVLAEIRSLEDKKDFINPPVHGIIIVQFLC